FQAVARGDGDRSALRQIERLRGRGADTAHQRQDQRQPGPGCSPAHFGLLAVAPFSTSFAGPANSIEVPLSVAVKPCASSVPNGPSACTGSAPAAAPRVRSSDALAVTSVVPSSRYSVTSCD